MPGPPPKPANERKRRNKSEGTSSTSVVLPADELLPLHIDPPEPPDGLLAETVEVWQSVWSFAVATQYDRSDLVTLQRWIRLVDEAERMRRICASTHTVMVPVLRTDEAGSASTVYEPLELPGYQAMGSAGQIVESVESRKLDRLRKELRALEDRLGGSPMARFRLGWQKGEMARSLQSLTDEFQAALAQELAS